MSVNEKLEAPYAGEMWDSYQRYGYEHGVDYRGDWIAQIQTAVLSVTNLITGDGNNLTKLLMIDHIPPQGTQIYGSPANISRGLGENNPKDTGKVVATDGDQIIVEVVCGSNIQN